MQEYKNSNCLINTDINLYKCGMENCEPGHPGGPGVRDHYLIHYILDGKGTFKLGEKVYTLEKGDGFLVCPQVLYSYRADENEPWSYAWVGFNGLKAEHYLKQANLEKENPVFRYNQDDFLKECFNKMLDSSKLKPERDTLLLSLLYLFLSKLIEHAGDRNIKSKTENGKEYYLSKAIEYIEMNYSHNMTIAEVSSYVGINRKYMHFIFKEYTGVSPQEFLINLRVGKACELMKSYMLSIGDVARSVGYEDQLQFSRAFKKVKGICPSLFWKHLQ